NSIGNVMGRGSAEGKDGTSVNAEGLPAHQMKDGRANHMYISTVAVFDRKCGQSVKILVISADKKRGKRFLIQPVQPIVFIFHCFSVIFLAPDTAEISADDNKILFRHFFLFWKNVRGKSAKDSMSITGDVNHIPSSSPCWEINAS